MSNHIHEWRRKQRLIKAPIPDQLLADWFTKSLLPPISRDVSMGGVVTEERSISCTQYLDLVYSQSSTLSDLIPHAPRPTTNPPRTATKPPADGILCSVQTKMVAKPSKKQNQAATP